MAAVRLLLVHTPMYPPKLLRAAPAAGVAFALLVGCATADYGPEPSRQAVSSEGGCFRVHIEEAIELNSERLSAYAAVTDGDSTPISLALIASEKLTLLAADRFDERARTWERAGVGVLCDVFVPISNVPSFTPAVTPPATSYQHRSGTLLAMRLGWAQIWSGEEGVAEIIEAELDELAATPSYHCMERHVLESILRAAYLAPVHADQAAALDLPSPGRLSRDLIAAHIATLPLSTGLDRVAAPLQAAGVPILCNDVPPIDTP